METGNATEVHSAVKNFINDMMTGMNDFRLHDYLHIRRDRHPGRMHLAPSSTGVQYNRPLGSRVELREKFRDNFRDILSTRELQVQMCLKNPNLIRDRFG